MERTNISQIFDFFQIQMWFHLENILPVISKNGWTTTVIKFTVYCQVKSVKNNVYEKGKK